MAAPYPNRITTVLHERDAPVHPIESSRRSCDEPASCVSGAQSIAVRRPVFQSDFVTLDRHERTRGGIGPGAAVQVKHVVVLGNQRKMGVAAGHEPKAAAAGIFDGPMLDQLAVPLPPLRDSPDPSRGPVRHPLLDEIKHPAGDLGQPRDRP